MDIFKENKLKMEYGDYMFKLLKGETAPSNKFEEIIVPDEWEKRSQRDLWLDNDL